MPQNPSDSRPSKTASAPRAGSRLVAREALLNRLLEARRRRCVVIAGPAGCGKTTLLASWRQALMPLGFDVAWLALGPAHNELGVFLDSLLACLAELDPALTREAALLAGAADAEAAERLLVTLVRGIAAHPRDVVLVLDDVHQLADPGVREALQWLLDYAPPQLHLALGSRGAVRLSLDRLRSQGQTLELDLRDLRFSEAETEQFLRAQLGNTAELDRRAIRILHELSDGWVAGLQLFAMDWKQRKQHEDSAAGGELFARVPLRDMRAFSRYFEQEVLARLSSAELDALVSLAPCNRFCAPLCAVLSGQAEALDAAAALLARLEDDDLFIVPAEGPGPEAWYRLHPLLRETLQARFAALDEAARRQLHSRAWVWLRERGLFEEAIGHAVLAGEGQQAAELVERNAQALVVRGERRKLMALLRQLPPEQIEQSPTLRLWLARAHLYQREFDACARVIDELERDLPESDQARRFHLSLLRAALALQRDDAEGSVALMPRLLQLPPGAPAHVIGARSNILSWLHIHQGEYEQARRVQAESPPLLLDGKPLMGTAGGILQGRCLIGLSHAMEGQMTQAERTYRAVIFEAEQGGKACAESFYLATALLGDVLYELNHVEQARALLEPKIDVLERLSIPDAVLRALRVLSATHWLAGNRMEAVAYLERLEDYAVKNQLDRLLAHAIADRLLRQVMQGELVAAGAELARLEALDARYPDAGHGALAEIHELAERSHIRLAVAQGDLDGAAVRLSRLLADCEQHGRQRVAAHLLIKSAVVDARRGKVDAARTKTLEALRRGHKLGLVRSLFDADMAGRKLIREVTQSETLDPVLAFYVERLDVQQAPMRKPAKAKASAAERAPAGIAADAFSDREIEVLRLLAQAMPNKKIARALGLSPETVKWYLSRLYGKLQVAGRDEAVARIRDLNWDPAPNRST